MPGWSGAEGAVKGPTWCAPGTSTPFRFSNSCTPVAIARSGYPYIANGSSPPGYRSASRIYPSLLTCHLRRSSLQWIALEIPPSTKIP